MDITPIIGSLAGTLTTISFLPQLIKTWRTKSAKDISAIMLAVLSAGVVLWLIYGIYLDQLPIIIANLFTLILASMILILKVRYR